MEPQIIIVGAGLSGAVLADRFARVLGKRVLVIDKRDHIAGNCYDYINEDGHLVNKYGVHLFHTNDDVVYNYVRSFCDWMRYDYKAVARIRKGEAEELVPVPVNIETVNKLCDENIQTPEEMDAWLEANQVKYPEGISNGEEAAKARVGEKLYAMLFERYTKKQWDKSPAELDRSVLERIPVRRDHDTRYFSDKYQIIPVHGYTAFVRAMLDHPLITVKLGVDFFEVRDEPWLASGSREKLIYTGPIDRYFSAAGFPTLEYRSIRFEEERFPTAGYVLPNLVVNEPGDDVPYTRTVEYKHLPQNRGKGQGTSIVREYTMGEGEPYYPVVNPRNLALYAQYQALAEEEEKNNGVLFVGRLANYKYFNMDAAIKNALDVFAEL